MTRRRPISTLGRIGDRQRIISPILSSSVSQDNIINKINKLREIYNQEAYSRYNAEQFNSAIVIPNDATYVAHDIVPKQIVKTAIQPVKNYTDNKRAFVNDIYNSYYRTLTKGGTSDSDARRQAKFLAQKAAYETGYGVHMANTHNYGGHRTKDKGWLSFDSMDDFTRKDVKLLDKKWSNWRNSKTDKDFVKAITTNNGQGIYAPENEYKNYYGLSNRVNTYLNMNRRDLRYGGKARPKAWIGAAVGAATSLLGGILSSNAQERQQREQRRLQEHNAAIERAQSLTESLGLTQAAQKEYEDRFRLPYSCGGRRRLRYGVRITDGGYAIPMGHNTSLLRGGKHEDINETGQGGIGMKIGGKIVEGEDGEVVQKTPKEVRIFSDSIGIDGYSFAELVRMGYDKDKLFKIQQNMNGDYGINSKRRLRNGGSVSRPVERIVYEPGGVVQYSLNFDPYYTKEAKIARNKAKRDLGRKQLSSSNYLTKLKGLYNLYQGTPRLGGELEVDGQVYTGIAPSVGMRSVQNITKIAQNANKTKQALNAVKQSMAKAKNNIRADKTKGPKIINESKTVKQVIQDDVKRSKWLHSKPTQNNPYEGAKAGIYEGKFFEPNVGNLKFASTSDRIRGAMSNIDGRVASAIGLAAGTSIPVGILAYNTLTGKYDSNDTTNIVNNSINTKSNKPASDIKEENDITAKNTNSYDNKKFSTNFTNKISLGDNTVTIPDINTGLSIARLPSVNNVRHLSDAGRSTYIDNTSNPSLSNRSKSVNNVNTPVVNTITNTELDYTPEQELEYITSNIKNNINNNYSATSPENMYLGGYTPQQMEEIMKSPGSSAPTDTNRNGVNETPATNKFGTVFKGVDWASLAADAIGSIGSALINYNAASNIQDPVAPVRFSPGKLITNYNIAPRLAEASMMRGRMLRDSDEGVSSAARLNRRNDINMYTNNYIDKLYGEKTNKEIELLNADAMNQQQVNAQNVAAYNDYMNRLIASRNNRNLLKAQAIQGGISGLGDAVGNLFDQGKQRYSDQQAMRYYSALLPEEGRRYLKRSGVDFLRRGGKIY